MYKIAVIITFLITKVSAQENVKFFDRNFHNEIDKSISVNKRIYTYKDSLIEIKDFKENKLDKTGKFYGFTDLKNLDEFIWYYSNYMYNDVVLDFGNKCGFVENYKKNGKDIHSKMMYKNNQIKIIQIWKDKQTPILINGTGKYEKYYSDSKENYIRIIKDSIETESYIVREIEKDTLYNKVDIQAKPQKSLKEFHAELTTFLDYPTLAEFLGVSKKITIYFVVNEKGELSDFRTKKVKSFNFENKTIEKLKMLPNWYPAILNGKPVKTQFALPITFKME